MDIWMLGVGPAVSTAVSKCSVHRKLLDLLHFIPVVSFDMKHHILIGIHEHSEYRLQKVQTVTGTTIWSLHIYSCLYNPPHRAWNVLLRKVFDVSVPPAFSVLSSGYSWPDPESGVVPSQSGTTEGGRCYSAIGQPAAEGSPGHTETHLLCSADIPGGKHNVLPIVRCQSASEFIFIYLYT